MAGSDRRTMKMTAERHLLETRVAPDPRDSSGGVRLRRVAGLGR